MFGSLERHFTFSLQNERLSGGTIGGKRGCQRSRDINGNITLNVRPQPWWNLNTYVPLSRCCYLSMRCIAYMYDIK